MVSLKFEELTSRVIGCAIEVHRGLGSGLLESSYEQCLAHELTLAGLSVMCFKPSRPGTMPPWNSVRSQWTSV